MVVGFGQTRCGGQDRVEVSYAGGALIWGMVMTAEHVI